MVVRYRDMIAITTVVGHQQPAGQTLLNVSFGNRQGGRCRLPDVNLQEPPAKTR